MSFKLLVGSYTAFITALSFTSSGGGTNGTLSLLSQSNAGSNPSWIAFHPRNTSVLYASQENENGQILSFTVDPTTGQLTQRGTAPSGGGGPAHFAVLQSGNEIVAANYDGGSVEDIPLNPLDVAQLSNTTGPIITFTGSGPNKDSQASSHPHQVVEYIPNTELLVPDLVNTRQPSPHASYTFTDETTQSKGSDKVWRLSRTPSGWQNVGSIAQPAGSGPRHIVVHEGSLYILHELSNTLTQQTIPPLGSLLAPQSISSQSIIPTGASNTTLGAGELLLSPKNAMYPTQYLYATNRNDPDPAGDSIAIFALDPLRLVAQVRTGLKHIRAAAIGGANGEYLVAGGLNGGGIVVFLRTNGGQSLTELARYNGVVSPTSFAFF
ncbi:hypothetical protein FRB99_001363 [Tulasnella sp. 403]|nr:hypothetical protein FRB99_001363 [Tulasnella sp. 403]